MIEVSLSDQGMLLDARIQRTSGDAALDAAALQILRLASPFDYAGQAALYIPADMPPPAQTAAHSSASLA